MSRILPLAILSLLPVQFALAGAPEAIGFNEQIRPILSNTCFFCHGPDEKHREAKLRLDLRDEALKERDGFRAIVPGKPEESELLVRITSHDKDEVMPPPKSKKPLLSKEEVETLRKWIEQGAKYEGHWAFQPIRRDPPPAVKDQSWARNDLDRFIEARLEREGIPHSPEADRPTLIRRVYLDLIGLLPSPEEVERFVKDPAPDAYERLVDSLLASPHHGERWGRHWLDQARYADSNGYSIDSERAMWPYRDWVIKALNDDMPFDQFTIEQLAGDLLPHPKKSQLIASAFHRNTLINEEGGVKPEQFRIESVIDRVNTTSSVWLGLTVGCAQCHSHKFDPIPHREYYQMFAFFNQGEDINNKGATIEVARGEVFGGPSAEERRQQEIAAMASEQPAWEKAELARRDAAPDGQQARWSVGQYLEYDTAGNGGFQLLPDNSLLSDGGGPFNDTYRVVAKTPLKQVAAVRLRVLTHDSLPQRGPGFARNGNFVLTDFTASVGGVDQSIATAFADHEQPGYAALAAIDADPKTGWAINVAKGSAQKMNVDHEIVFVFEKPIPVGSAPFEFKMHHDLNEKYLIGRFALDFTDTTPTEKARTADPVTLALKVPFAARNPEQTKLVQEAFEAANRETLSKKERKAKERNPNSDVVELMVMKDIPKPRPTYLFQRGDFLRPDEKLGPLEPGVLTAVSADMQPMNFHNRLDLAQWLVAPDNPLTARVTMNRMWMRYFGRGLAETDDDFGSQGSPPTHPELLDWLAGQFIRSGWHMKAMHRLIVTSATYRQASLARPDLAEKDPRNLLLARQSRVRVEAEIIRDAALSASGLLDRTIGGPSVRPPQPEGVYSFTQTSKKWVTDTGPNRYRRALYTMFYRSAPHPLFTTFDTPDFQTVCTRRTRSNTPLQALALANDEVFFELAQGLAARVVREVPEAGEGTVTARLKRAFFLAACREPSAREQEILQRYYDGQKRTFADDPGAQTVTSKDLAALGLPPDSAAALVCVARAILNSDTFVTRE